MMGGMKLQQKKHGQMIILMNEPNINLSLLWD